MCVCLSVCLSVCLVAYLKNHMFKLGKFFRYMSITVAVSLSFSNDNNAIRCVHPICGRRHVTKIIGLDECLWESKAPSSYIATP